MEPVPALFTGVAMGGFGAALLVWTAVRLRHRLPVAAVGGRAAAVVSAVCGTVALAIGLWCLTRL